MPPYSNVINSLCVLFRRVQRITVYNTLIHHTIDTFLKFQWASALSSGKAESRIALLLEVVGILERPL